MKIKKYIEFKTTNTNHRDMKSGNERMQIKNFQNNNKKINIFNKRKWWGGNKEEPEGGKMEKLKKSEGNRFWYGAIEVNRAEIYNSAEEKGGICQIRIFTFFYFSPLYSRTSFINITKFFFFVFHTHVRFHISYLILIKTT